MLEIATSTFSGVPAHWRATISLVKILVAFFRTVRLAFALHSREPHSRGGNFRWIFPKSESDARTALFPNLLPRTKFIASDCITPERNDIPRKP